MEGEVTVPTDIALAEQPQPSVAESPERIPLQLSEFDLETDLSRYLNSDEFIETLNTFEDDVREHLIGLVLNRTQLHGNLDGIQEFIHGLRTVPRSFGGQRIAPEAIEAVFLDEIRQKLGVMSEELSSDDTRRIYDYVIGNIEKNGYFYHGFNGIFERSIREKGLSANDRAWGWGDVKELSTIFGRNGIGLATGWGVLNSEGKVYLTTQSGLVYRYAIASPEWFAQLTSEGFHIPLDRQGYDKKAYYRKDYEACQRNLEQCMADHQFNPEDRRRAMALFDASWNRLVDQESKPKVALVKKRAVRAQYLEESYSEYEARMKRVLIHLGIVSNEKLVHFMLLPVTGDNNSEIPYQGDIQPEDIRIIELPEYNRVNPR